jgi:hypothetical protein
MVDRSLYTLLQRKLRAVTLGYLHAVELAGQMAFPPLEVWLEQGQGLRLGRSPDPIRYGSGLPLAVASVLGQEAGADVAMALAAAWSEQGYPCHLQRSPGRARTIVAQTQAQALPSGQLVVDPTPTALGLWLQTIAIAPLTVGAFASLASPVPPLPALRTKATWSQRLHLSPLAFVQYMHYQCHRLSSGGGPSPAHPGPFIAKTAAEQRVLWGLINLCDRQARRSPTASFEAGYHLAVATDQWLAPLDDQVWSQSCLPGPSTSLTPVVLLRGVTYALGRLLTTLGQSAPTAL